MRVFRGASAGARGPLAALGGSWRLSGRPKSRGGLGDHKYNNEHECWEKTVTEGMAMQADHKHNNEHECWEKTVTEVDAI